MKKTLTPIGEELGIVIDKPILDLLGIDTDTLLEVKTDGTGLIIRPVVSADLDLPEPAIGDGDLDAGVSMSIEPPPPLEADPAAVDDEAMARRPTKAKEPGEPPELVIMHKGKEERRVTFDQESIVIGRDARCDVHLEDRALSRRHVRFEKRGAAIWVSDLGSANGTYINDERADKAMRLEAGDEIEIGHYLLRIEGLEERAIAETPVLTLNGPEGMHRFALVGDSIMIGRSQSCDISIGHKSISRRHVRILVEGGAFAVEDLGSQNGCKLNGKRLKGRAPFAVGDRLTICDFSLEVGYLQDPEDGKAPRPKTMLVDKSVMAGAAYVEGDMENMSSDVGLRVGADPSPRPDTGEHAI